MNPCSMMYSSTESLNQPETQAWDNWIKELIQDEGGPVLAQISIHSFG